MHRLRPLLALPFVLVSVGCFRPAHHGRVLPPVADDDPFVTVEAGNVRVAMQQRARYFVDRTTQTCWLHIGTAFAQMDCCDARRAEALRGIIAWESDASCARR